MRISKTVLPLLLCLACASAFAAGDPAAGKIKSNTCTGCHGIPYYKTTYPTYSVPRIGGQNAPYIISALKEYKSGARKHPTMNPQAQALSDQDIEDIAAYLASLAPKKESGE